MKITETLCFVLYIFWILKNCTRTIRAKLPEYVIDNTTHQLVRSQNLVSGSFCFDVTNLCVSQMELNTWSAQYHDFQNLEKKVLAPLFHSRCKTQNAHKKNDEGNFTRTGKQWLIYIKSLNLYSCRRLIDQFFRKKKLQKIGQILNKTRILSVRWNFQ